MVRVKRYEVGEILPLINKRDITKLGRYRIRTKKIKLRVFKKSLKCTKCGLRGNIFILEKDKREHKELHLNLYHKYLNGEYTLMTKDHIIPKAKGGQTIMSNLQTMCFNCNSRKGDKVL